MPIENPPNSNSMLNLLPMLSGVVTTQRGGRLAHDAQYRKYMSTVKMVTELQSIKETSTKSNIYEIGLQGINKTNNYGQIEDLTACWQQQINLNDIVANSLVTLNKKYTNFTGDYKACDLSAVGYHLAKTIAIYCSKGDITTQEMRCGQPISVRMLGAADQPITASATSVFIPRTASTLANPAIFSVLLSACNAYGATVYTDILQMDANNAPIITDYSNWDVVDGCYGALRVLMSMYDNSGYGGVMAFAIVKGMHAINSVVAHSDEGGFMRDVLRQGDFVTPYGGIWTDDYESYSGLPVVSFNSDSQLCASVDSILLSSAALTAVCDPCVMIAGKVYPTVFSAVGRNNLGKENMKNVSKGAGVFCENYSRALLKLFSTTGDVDIVSKYIETSMHRMVHRDMNWRHLNYRVVAPFFWIEPTSVLPKNFGTIAENAGFASLTTRNNPSIYPAFPNANIEAQLGTNFLMTYEHVSARRVSGLEYLNMHALDGLAGIVPHTFLASKVVLAGGDESCENLREEGADVSNYMWGRGQSMLCHPAEMIYVGQRMAVMVNTGSMDDRGNYTSQHVWDANEIVNATISYECTNPMRYNDGVMGEFPRTVRRDRTNGVKALQNARELLRSQRMTGGEIFIPSESEITYVATDNRVADEQVAGDVVLPVNPMPVMHRGPIARVVHNDTPQRPPRQNPAVAQRMEDVRPGLMQINPNSTVNTRRQQNRENQEENNELPPPGDGELAGPAAVQQ